MTKTCSKCLEVKELSQFYNRSASKDGLQAMCKMCCQGWQDDNRLQRRESWNKHARKKRMQSYGLEESVFAKMLEEQDGKCSICRIPFGPQGRMGDGCNVDHCHTGGHVRGLLCNNCNQGLGRFKDNPTFLLAAAQYILTAQPMNK